GRSAAHSRRRARGRPCSVPEADSCAAITDVFDGGVRTADGLKPQQQILGQMVVQEHPGRIASPICAMRRSYIWRSIRNHAIVSTIPPSTLSAAPVVADA